MNDIIQILKKRFEDNSYRHLNANWDKILKWLDLGNIKIIEKMEETGGEPDCVEIDSKLFYIDMVSESPKGRRSLCYDKESRLARKNFPPDSSVEELAEEIGIEVVDESMYLHLQRIDKLDEKTSSWLKTDNNIRILGGAIFGDRRFNRTFIFHNSADSYYKDRGFRGYIEIK